MPGLGEVLAAERERVEAGSATVCGYACDCHAAGPCERSTHDVAAPHAFRDSRDELIQWASDMCTNPQEG